MVELIIVGIVTVIIFAAAYYQSYRDKERWNRISSGMSLFGEREDIPPLVIDGVTFDSHERRVVLVWGDGKKTSYETVSDALRRIGKESSTRAAQARVFAWDGESWKQRR